MPGVFDSFEELQLSVDFDVFSQREEEQEQLFLEDQAKKAAFSVSDAFLGIFSGVESGVRDIAALGVDAVDFLTFDAVPDELSEFLARGPKLLGERTTTAGQFIEGATQFFVGFIPAIKVLKGVQAFGKLGKAARFGRELAAGAIADFASFDAQEARFSDFIQQMPGLANPVSEFLASDPEDGEAEGRFKAALEGLFLGPLSDLALLGGRKLVDGTLAATAGIKAGRLKRAQGASEDAVEAAFFETVERLDTRVASSVEPPCV